MGRRHRAALDLKQQLVQSPDCVICGQRLGKHRYGTDQCPNLRWQAGNGQPQWLNTTYSEEARIVVPWLGQE